MAGGSVTTDHDMAQVDRANASEGTPVVFIDGLWLLASSWDRWAEVFEDAGYTAVTLRSGSPVLGNPANRSRAVPLTYEQVRYAFANAVSEEVARYLHETFAVSAPGKPLFQAAAANLNPWTEAKVSTEDHLMPPKVQWSNAKHYRDDLLTEVVEFSGRPHLLPAAPGWEDIADYALAWAVRHARTARVDAATADAGRA
jgi:hypothetical protein